MLKHPYAQYLLPQHLLSKLAGALANSHTPWLKRHLINRFMRDYQIDLSEAVISDPNAYPCFNDFFIRQLKPGSRPIAVGDHAIVSPVDGSIAQIGDIKQKQLLQAKNFYFDLDTLLGGDTTLAQQFYDGKFATLYLAPHNYHRVHMPIAGRLIQTIYVPGKLFSVNRMTSELIPHLYSRNERFIAVFETPVGTMAVILVGAMLVGAIQMAWMNTPVRTHQMLVTHLHQPITFAKGDELGYFKLGSTVILLFGKNKIAWQPNLEPTTTIKVGQLLVDNN